MVVAFTEMTASAGGSESVAVIQKENRTFGVGCSCVANNKAVLAGFADVPMQKRSYSPVKLW